MDKKYRELFTLMTQTTANIAEQVMNLHKSNEENNEYTTAETMRDDFLKLHDKLIEETELVKADYARLLVGTFIVATQLDNKIKNDQKALQGYRMDIIPKLDQIVNAADEETVLNLASDLFKIKEDKNSNN